MQLAKAVSDLKCYFDARSSSRRRGLLRPRTPDPVPYRATGKGGETFDLPGSREQPALRHRKPRCGWLLSQENAPLPPPRRLPLFVLLCPTDSTIAVAALLCSVRE